MSLKECKKILKQRLIQLQQKPHKIKLIVAYQEVLADLIDNTDPCTGVLY